VDYFIWELGVFKEGAKVNLGDNLVLARITGIVGVGRNFIKFGVETLGSSFKDDYFSFSRRFPPFLLSMLQVFLFFLVFEIDERLC
jgi:hypothetical protein